MKVSVPYGDHWVTGEVPGGGEPAILDVYETPALPEDPESIWRGLNTPIGTPLPLEERIDSGHSVLIVVPDSFRASRADLIVPVLLEQLRRKGVSKNGIRILFATGSHRAPTEDEQRAILTGAVFTEYADQIHIHDARDGQNLVNLRETARGTPVFVNRLLVESDRVITIGAVVFHYFAGFGGGRKMVVPGCAGLETIARNHARTLDPNEDRIHPAVTIGRLDGNPVAEDLLEASRMVPVNYAVCTVLNHEGRLGGLFAGEQEAAHRAACTCAAKLYGIPLSEPADLVIAAAPEPRNFLQAHKALYNAYRALAPHGRIVFLAPCPEGLGGDQFTQWLRLGDTAAIAHALRQQGEINGQSALSTREKAPKTHFVTELSAADVALLGGRKSPSLQEALDSALAELPTGHPRVCVMPHAGVTVPQRAGAPRTASGN